MIVRTDVLGRLERGAKVGFLGGVKEYTALRAPFCQEVSSDGAFEMYTDMGTVPWPRQNAGQGGAGGTDARTGYPQVSGLHEGGPITVLGGNERGLVVFNDDWEIPLGIWHNAINDDRIGGLEAWARNAGWRFNQHMDYLAFTALNSGDGTTYGACYDSLSFFNNNHVDKGAEYTTVQDNVYALTLSLDNFETVRVAAAGIKDDRGQPCGYNYNLLVSAVNLERVAAQIIENREAYDTANREMNPYAGKVRGITAPGGWVDSTFWALIAADMPVKPVNLQIREKPTLVFWDDFTQGGGVRYFKWHARYQIFYGDWRLTVMGNT